jgi:hypothetical protein
MLGMVIHASNLSTWDAEEKDLEFSAGLGHIVRPDLYKRGEGSTGVYTLLSLSLVPILVECH